MGSVRRVLKCRSSEENAVEHGNSVIWTRVPKAIFVRFDTLRFAIYDAVLCLNDGVVKIE
jgi:hypothetical protein